jgi:hypothetical protein
VKLAAMKTFTVHFFDMQRGPRFHVPSRLVVATYFFLRLQVSPDSASLAGSALRRLITNAAMQFTFHQQKVGRFLVEIHMKAGLITSLDGDRLPNWGRTRMCVCVCVSFEYIYIYAYTNINSTMIRIISYLFRQNRMLISLFWTVTRIAPKNQIMAIGTLDFTPCHLHFVTKFRKK